MEAILAITLIVLLTVVLWMVSLRRQNKLRDRLLDDQHGRVVALERRVEQIAKWQGGR